MMGQLNKVGEKSKTFSPTRNYWGYIKRSSEGEQKKDNKLIPVQLALYALYAQMLIDVIYGIYLLSHIR